MSEIDWVLYVFSLSALAHPTKPDYQAMSSMENGSRSDLFFGNTASTSTPTEMEGSSTYSQYPQQPPTTLGYGSTATSTLTPKKRGRKSVKPQRQPRNYPRTAMQHLISRYGYSNDVSECCSTGREIKSIFGIFHIVPEMNITSRVLISRSAV